MATTIDVLTAEEYFAREASDRPTELVGGRIVEGNPPSFRHGAICARAVVLLGRFVEARGVGWLTCNDAGVITTRNPDSVRGPDVAFYSYDRVPAEAQPKPYPQVAPDAVVEVRSPRDRWSDLLIKTGEYIQAGVRVVVVLDPEPQTVTVFRPDQPPQVVASDEPLTLPEITADREIRPREFFTR